MTLKFLPCPACERVTALTAEVSANTRLRCPHCGGVFSYSTLFREPRGAQWQVVDSESEREPAVGSKTIDEMAETASSLTLNMTDRSAQTLVDRLGEYEGLELELEPPDQLSPDYRAHDHRQYDDGPYELEQVETGLVAVDSEADAPSVGESKQPAHATNVTAKASDWSAFQPLTPQSYERQKRKKQSSPVWSVLQVALGGLAAIPCAMLLVWHVIGTDVGDAGPWVGKYAPWIVPEKFRPYQALTTREPRIPTPAGSGLPMVQVTPVDNMPVDNRPVDDQVQDETTGEQSQRPGTSKVEGLLPEPAPASTGPMLDQNPALTQSPSEVELNAPLLENTFAMIRQANEHLDDWSASVQAGDVDLKTLAPATYRDLTNLALVIDQLPQENLMLRPVRRQLGILGKQVAEKPEVQRLVVEGSRSWVKTHAVQATVAKTAEASGQGFGLAMIFIVEQAQEVADVQGNWWRVVATNASRLGEPALEIRIPRDVALSLTADQIVAKQMLFLLGMVRPVVEKPASEVVTAPDQPVFVASYGMEL